MKKNDYTINGRIWIETPKGKVLGHGRVELLERIQASGSLRQAALQMKMSYKQAWDMIKQINDGFGEPLASLSRGGAGGGKAIITPKGLHVIAEFKKLQQNLTNFMKEQETSINL